MVLQAEGGEDEGGREPGGKHLGCWGWGGRDCGRRVQRWLSEFRLEQPGG